MKFSAKKVIGCMVGVAVLAVASAYMIPHHVSAEKFDYAKYNVAKKAEVDKDLKEALAPKAGVATANNNSTVTPQAISKPNFKIHKVDAMPNGTYQFGFLNQGPTKVQDLWLKDLKSNSDQSLWNEQYVFSGVSKDDSSQGVIGAFVVNTKEWQTFNVPGDVKGNVHIDSINGENISYTTGSGTGSLNVVTGNFTN